MPAGSAPGANSRGRGGKFKKYTRGGGKHFSRDLQPLDAEGNQVSMWSPDAKNKDEEDNEEESEEESSEEDEENKADDNGELSREDRKSLKKARKDAAIAKQSARTVEVGDMPTSDEESDEDLPANPNHTKAARSLTRVDDGVDDITEGVKKLPASRKEREAVEAAAAKERYLKLQSQGKTDEAKADLERLKAIREQRASEAARRQAEKEEKEEQEKVRRAEIDAKEAKKREAAAGPKKSSKRK